MKFTNTLLSLILLVCLFAAYQIYAVCGEAGTTFNRIQILVLQGEELIQRANSILERKPWRPFGDEPPTESESIKE